MFIEFVRNDTFSASLHNMGGFIFVAEVKYRTLKTSWGSSCDDIFNTNQRKKVLQVNENFLTKYIRENTYNDMIVQESSWYFDITNQLIYLHITHNESPLTSKMDYGYSFGVTNNDVVYIDDVEYLPLIKDAPDLDRETDYTNSEQPTGSTGSITLSNMEHENENGIKEGRLDFLLSENIYGNDVFFYTIESGALVPVAMKYIEDISIGINEVEISLQDRRFS